MELFDRLDWLTLLILTPLVGALILLLVPGRRVEVHRWGALAISLVAFALSLLVAVSFDNDREGFQLVQTVDWIGFFGIQYKVGVDGISLVLILLTTLLTSISILASFGPITTRVKEYMIAFLVLEVGMLGVFLSLDLFLFYVFWEVVLVPMYLIIGIWGGANRIYATIKFVIYTLVGSLLMLVAILAVAWSYFSAMGTWEGAFDYTTLVAFGFEPTLQFWAFLGFFLAFAIKVPMWPVHTWLPDAHTEAPTAGSVILAGVLLKLGGYGLIRMNLPLFPDATRDLAPFIVALSIVGMLYGAIVAIRQTDLKRLIAYSSVSHMGFVTLGIFVLNEQGVQGAIFQMVGHGVITGALFLLVGVIYERTHDRTIAKMGGLGQRVPVFATLMVFFSLASAGLPGLAGFVGEFLVLLGAFDWEPWVGYVAAFTIIFAAVYLLYMVQNIIMGDVTDFLRSLGTKLTDVDRVEAATLAPLVLLAVALGLFPALVLDLTQAPVESVLAVVEGAAEAAVEATAGLLP
ncbi:MAG: NADH-quinone oxidoreductase subunit M [Candidatus Limnocylindrales bacterium]